MTPIAADLTELLDDADVDAVLAALAGRTIAVDDFAARCWPARAYGDWLDGLGLDTLAQRARTALPQQTPLGEQFAELISRQTIRLITVD